MADPVTSTDINTVLKDVLWPSVINYVFLTRPISSLIKRVTRELVGKVIKIPARTGLTQGLGAAAEGDVLPTAGKTVYIKPQFSPKYHYGRIKVGGIPMALSRTKAAAWVQAWVEETQGLMQQFEEDFAREFCGDGLGRLAYLADGTNTLTPSVYCQQGPKNANLGRDNMLVDLIDASDNATVLVAGAALTAAEDTQWTVGTATGASCAAGDYYVRKNSLGNEWCGLHAIVDTADPTLANFGALDRDLAVNRKWRGHKLDFDNDLTFELIDEVMGLASGRSTGKINSIWMRDEMARDIVAMLRGNVRYANKVGKVDLGYDAPSYNGIPMVSDDMIHKGTMLGLDTSTIELAEVHPLSWMDKDGSVVKWVANYDAWQAAAFHYGEMICTNPHANVKGYNIGAPAIALAG